MRNPRKLLHEMGFLKFFGLQVLFLGTLSQFLLAPVLWSFWLVPLGLSHPLAGALPAGGLIGLGVLFLLSEIITISVGMLAVSGPKHRFLIAWVPTLHVYFPLGALASYKAFYELLTRPFYWDKTMHGVFGRTQITPPETSPPETNQTKTSRTETSPPETSRAETGAQGMKSP